MVLMAFHVSPMFLKIMKKQINDIVIISIVKNWGISVVFCTYQYGGAKEEHGEFRGLFKYQLPQLRHFSHVH